MSPKCFLYTIFGNLKPFVGKPCGVYHIMGNVNSLMKILMGLDNHSEIKQNPIKSSSFLLYEIIAALDGWVNRVRILWPCITKMLPQCLINLWSGLHYHILMYY